jgi:hypothetical protein
MLTADIAKIFLTHVKNYLAQAITVKMRASVVLVKREMRSSLERNTVNDPLGIAALKLFVPRKSAFVNIDLPTDTTAVLATTCDTYKIFIIRRRTKLHNIALTVSFLDELYHIISVFSIYFAIRNAHLTNPDILHILSI